MVEGDITAYFSFNHIINKNILSDLATIFFLSIILIPSAIADYREQKIPNLFTMSGWLIGPVMHFMLSGVDGLLQSCLGFILLFSLTFPFWILRWFGAADVKLISSVGAILGGYQVLSVLLGIVLTGLVISLAMIILHGDFFVLLRSLYFRSKSLYFKFVWHIDLTAFETEPTRSSRDQAIPYAVPIAFGTFITILYLHA